MRSFLHKFDTIADIVGRLPHTRNIIGQNAPILSIYSTEQVGVPRHESGRCLRKMKSAGRVSRVRDAIERMQGAYRVGHLS